MINPKEDAVEKPFDIIVYHVVDKNGTHRFLTMNSLSPWLSEGREGFERVLAKQYKTFELVGSTPIIVSSDDPPKAQFPDPDGRDRLDDRIRALMNAFPNASKRLEAWLPDPEERVEWSPAEHVRSPWRPMSTLKQAMGGKVDFDRIAIAFVDKDVSEMVKPEFVDVVRTRGRALLREFKEDVRKVLEQSLLREIEESAGAPDRQGGPAAPDECKTIPNWEVNGKVMTEYVSAARERGGALRRELKEDVRK
jgi:hypothetical protein